MKKIAFIGAGGINSWAFKHLIEMSKTFDKQELLYICIFDDDVVEEKNILRSSQDYTVEDLMMPKAEVLGKRYKYLYQNERITKENLSRLDNFTDIILGVDNNKTRQILYEYALEKKKYLLDMRAQGTIMSFIVIDHKKDMSYYNEKYFSNEMVMERVGSCQLKVDIEKDHIENGNKIIAYFGMYGVYLKHLRDEELATNEWKMVY